MIDRTTHTPRTAACAAAMVCAAALALAATPAPAVAGNCGTDYLVCLNDRGLLDGSDWLHEMECQTEYWNCVSRQILAF